MSNRSVITNSTGIGADSSSAALLPGIVGGAVSLLVAVCFLYLYYRFCCAAASVFAALARGTAVTAAGAAARAVGAEVGGAATTASAESGADATEAIWTAAAGAALPPDVDAASFCR